MANVNNYIAAGRSAVRKNLQARQALAENKADYGALGQEAIKAERDKKIAIIQANAKVANAAQNAMTQVKGAEIQVDMDKSIANSKRQARKAGMLAGGAALLGVGAMRMNKKHEPDGMLAKYQELIGKNTSRLSAADQKIKDARDKLNSFTDEPASTDTSTTDTPTPTPSEPGKQSTSKMAGGTKTGLRLMNDLIKDGYSPTAAAAVAGNAQHESAGFTAYEEFEPNSYGTKGAGILQWTNAGGGNRRSEFETWTKNKGLDPTSYEANSGYLKEELRGGAHWTGGGNTADLKGMNNLSSATSYFMNNYLRPNADHQHLDRRLSNAQTLLDQWNSQTNN